MKFSIIVPVYNVENYIIKCLKSVKEQTLNDFECLIIDDGSLDSSIDKANEYIKDDNRFKILHKSNGGLSDARNYGLDYAKGDYIFFLDSDDYIDKTLLEKTYNLANKYNSDITCFDLYYEYDDGRKDLSIGGYTENTNYQDDKKVLFINHSANNKIFKREFLNDKRFIYGISYEDLASVPIWIAKANNVSYLNEPLYFYMQRNTSISHSYDERIFDIFKAINNVKDNLNLNSEDVSEMYLKQAFQAIILKIRTIKDDKQRLDFYNLIRKHLNDSYPNWFNYIKKENISFKWKLVAFLLNNNMISILDKLYSK